MKWIHKERVTNKKKIASSTIKQYYRSLCAGLKDKYKLEVKFMDKEGIFKGVANAVSKIMKEIKKKGKEEGDKDGTGKESGHKSIKTLQHYKGDDIDQLHQETGLLTGSIKKKI